MYKYILKLNILICFLIFKFSTQYQYFRINLHIVSNKAYALTLIVKLDKNLKTKD